MMHIIYDDYLQSKWISN